MIKFNCPNCGQKLKVPDDRADNKGKCPKCRNPITVPQAPQIPAGRPLPTLNFADSEPPSGQAAPDSDAIHIPPVSQPANEQGEFGAIFPWARETPPLARSNATQEDASSQTDTQAGIVDMLAYPISISGIIHLIIFFALGILMRPAINPSYWMGPPIWHLILLVITGGYCLYYFTNCVRCSSAGERRAPDINSQPGSLDLVTIRSQFYTAFAWAAFCFAPAIIYFDSTGRIDIIFILLAAYAILYAPIALLGIVMFDSVRALNPILIIPSILSVFVPYIFLLVGLFIAWGTIAVLYLWRPLLGGASAYLVILTAHILGRFYMKYQNRLNWEA